MTGREQDIHKILKTAKNFSAKQVRSYFGNVMKGIKRVGVTFPPDLLEDLDDIIEKMGYASRSKAVQDAARLFISDKKWFQEECGECAGVLMMLYDHEARGLEGALTHIQHHFANVIFSSMHIHMNERDCLEAIAVKGSVAEIRRLSDELSTEKGVKILKTMLVPA